MRQEPMTFPIPPKSAKQSPPQPQQDPLGAVSLSFRLASRPFKTARSNEILLSLSRWKGEIPDLGLRALFRGDCEKRSRGQICLSHRADFTREPCTLLLAAAAATGVANDVRVRHGVMVEEVTQANSRHRPVT